MGFPIVLGGRSLSCRKVASPSPVEEDANDGCPLVPNKILGNDDDSPSVVVFGRQDQTNLGATVLISYYDMIRSDNGNVEWTVAEIAVQLSPLNVAFSNSHKEMIHRIQLPPPPRQQQQQQQQQQQEEEANPNELVDPRLSFSSDGLSLAVLVPYPHHHHDPNHNNLSCIVVFQLRKPKMPKSVKPPPPRPSYMSKSAAAAAAASPAESWAPVATNPRIVQGIMGDGLILHPITTICNASLDKSSILLAGCVDGSVWAIAYRQALVAGVLEDSPFGGDALVWLRHVTTQPSRMQQERNGNLVAIRRNGSALVYATELVLKTAEDEEPSSSSSLLLIRIEPLTVLMAPSGPTPCFACAEWISPHLLALAVVPHANQHATAQVWAVYKDRSAEPMATLKMTAETLKEDAHGTFCLTQDKQEQKRNHRRAGSVGIHCDHQKTGCIAISSFVVKPVSQSPRNSPSQHGDAVSRNCVQPFVCIWDWLSNVVGFTLTSREALSNKACFHSHLCFANDYKLVHVLGSNRVRKEIHDFGVLSPPESFGVGNITERSCLMLSSKSVSFPLVSNPTASNDCEVEWKECAIPSSYTLSFGAPLLAAVGKRRGTSIAVAASRGLCICDTSKMSAKQGDAGSNRVDTNHAKWRLFGSELEERSFRVLSMTWWESSDAKTDDLLVAVIQNEDSTDRKEYKKKYLACWSRKRLHFAGQRLSATQGQETNRMGIPLPDDFVPSSMSLLSDEHRAVLLLHSVDDAKLVYHVFQLQTVWHEPKDGLSFRVLCQSSRGNLSLHESSSGYSISSVFLVGPSFQFDLQDKEGSRDHNKFLATVAIVKTPGMGLDVATVTKQGPPYISSIIPGVSSTESFYTPALQVSKFWLSDIVVGKPGASEHENLSQINSFHVWAIELLDGTLLCWMVPFLSQHHTEVILFPEEYIYNGGSPYQDMYLNSETELHPPYSVRRGNSIDDALAGILCFINDAPTWINGSSSSVRSEYTLGSMPHSSFGWMLSAGQNSKSFHRIVPGGFDSGSFTSNFLDHEVFAVSECTLTSPAFLPCLFASFLVAADARDEHPQVLSAHGDFVAILKRHAISRVCALSGTDTVLAALRLLLLRSLDLTARKASFQNSEITSSMLSEIVNAARFSLGPVEFASFFLGIGRQIEPHRFPLLFPLPAAVIYQDANFPRDGVLHMNQCAALLDVQNLYDAAESVGSISTAASALPLCSSKSDSHSKCYGLLRHCIRSLLENSTDRELFDSSTESQMLLQDLFQFGVKLEDSKIVGKEGVDVDEPTPNGSAENHASDAEETASVESDTSSDLLENHTVIPKLNQNESIVGRVFPFLWRRASTKQLEEDAIYEAASMFIMSGFEENDIMGCLKGAANESQTNGGPNSSSTNCSMSSGTKINSVAGLVASVILAEVFSNDSAAVSKWRKLLLVARYLSGDRLKVPPYSEESQVCRELSGELLLCDLAAEFSDVNFPSTHVSAVAEAYGLEGSESIVVNSIMTMIRDCQAELSKTESSIVLDFVLACLSRKNVCADIEALLPRLVIVAVVSGHTAGRVQAALDISKDADSDVKRSYLLATSAITPKQGRT